MNFKTDIEPKYIYLYSYSTYALHDAYYVYQYDQNQL